MSETSLVKTTPHAPVPSDRPEVATVVPTADLVQTTDGYRLTVDLPGVRAGDLEVHLEKGVLSVSAEPAGPDEDGWESLYGHGGRRRYHRSFPLSDEIDGEKIGAEMKAGVLTVTLPRPASLGRRIAVNAGA